MPTRFISSQRFQKPAGWDVRQHEGPHGMNESRSRIYEPVIADLELVIDVEGLMRRLGGKAVCNKSGKSAAFEGLN